jgi:hypothetical protein
VLHGIRHPHATGVISVAEVLPSAGVIVAPAAMMMMMTEQAFSGSALPIVRNFAN